MSSSSHEDLHQGQVIQVVIQAVIQAVVGLAVEAIAIDKDDSTQMVSSAMPILDLENDAFLASVYLLVSGLTRETPTGSISNDPVCCQ